MSESVTFSMDDLTRIVVAMAAKKRGWPHGTNAAAVWMHDDGHLVRVVICPTGGIHRSDANEELTP